MKGLLGRKIGMTQMFTDEGHKYPVTIIDTTPNVVLQVKTLDKDGYESVKLGFADKKDNKANKAELGIAKKASTSAKYFIKEIKNLNLGEEHKFKAGDKLEASIFEVGQFVDVTGISKGKGFSGGIKRHNYSIGPKAHGSKYHRKSGSMGDIRSTVKKSKKLPGHMGHEQVTMQNLVVVSIDTENNLLVIKGSIPGPNKSFVIVKDAIKKPTDLRKIFKLVDVKEDKIKNELLEEAKKWGAAINTSMSISEMKDLIVIGEETHKAELIEKEKMIDEATKLGITNPEKLKMDELKTAIIKGKETEAKRNAKTEETKSTEKTEDVKKEGEK